MSFNSNGDYESSSRDDYRRNQAYDANEADDRGLHTEAGRNSMNHFNNAAEEIGRAAAEFNSGGGRQAVEGVGNPLANRNENEGERENPFLKPAQMLAQATHEGLKGIPGAILEFATGQYEAHKMRPEGNQRDSDQSDSRQDR